MLGLHMETGVYEESLWVLCQIQHLEGNQREYEFTGLTPDTEFLGTTTIFVPTWSKESAPYVCRVRTLPGESGRSRREWDS